MHKDPSSILRIIPCDTKDVEKYLALRGCSIRKGAKDYYEEADIEKWASHYSIDKTREKFTKHNYYKAVIEEQIIGFVSWQKNEVETLYVDPDYFGVGHGTGLLKFAENSIIAESAPSKIVISASNNARSFYEKNGYQFIETRLNDLKTQYSYLEKIISVNSASWRL